MLPSCPQRLFPFKKQNMVILIPDVTALNSVLEYYTFFWHTTTDSCLCVLAAMLARPAEACWRARVWAVKSLLWSAQTAASQTRLWERWGQEGRSGAPVLALVWWPSWVFPHDAVGAPLSLAKQVRGRDGHPYILVMLELCLVWRMDLCDWHDESEMNQVSVNLFKCLSMSNCTFNKDALYMSKISHSVLGYNINKSSWIWITTAIAELVKVAVVICLLSTCLCLSFTLSLFYFFLKQLLSGICKMPHILCHYSRCQQAGYGCFDL